jgi:hypothetical protein
MLAKIKPLIGPLIVAIIVVEFWPRIKARFMPQAS